MRENNGGLNNLVRVDPLMLAIVSFVLTLIAGFTDLGQMKTFQFVVGGVAAITAIAYSLQAARRLREVSLLLAAIWLGTASINFVQTILVAK